MKLNGLAGRYYLLCLCFQLFKIFVKCTTDDEFYCTKTKPRSIKSKPRSVQSRRHKLKESDQFQVLEERLADLELRIEQMQTPNVIKIQSSALPRDCFDIFRSGLKTDGVYQISPDGRCPFDVFCDMQNGGWTVLQRRNFGNMRFNRKWEEYAEGFGDLHSDFWLGLDKMHRLTQAGSRLLIIMEHYNESKTPEWARYDGFVIGDVISGYEMNADPFGYEGSIKESLSYHNGMKFSTIDRDNDMQPQSCSQLYGGAGWWFLSCYRLGLLNGIYGKTDKGGISFWANGDNFVKNTELKVMPMRRSC